MSARNSTPAVTPRCRPAIRCGARICRARRAGRAGDRGRPGATARALPAPDVRALPEPDERAGPARRQRAAGRAGFDARMRARAGGGAGGRAPARSARWRAASAFEIATRARQAGVPAYAVTAENELDAFDARILDLQVILEAGRPARAERRRAGGSRSCSEGSAAAAALRFRAGAPLGQPSRRRRPAGERPQRPRTPAVWRRRRCRSRGWRVCRWAGGSWRGCASR